MNRRRFLKYGGAGAVAIGASALGADYLLRPPRLPIPSNETSSILGSTLAKTTSTSTSSSTTVLPTYILSGNVFADYDGDGKAGSDPPPVGLVLILRDLNNNIVDKTTIKKDGKYAFGNRIPMDNYVLSWTDDQNRFRFGCTGKEDLTSSQSGFRVSLTKDSTFSFGVMNGFLTHPFLRARSRIESYVDLDPGTGLRDWKCEEQTYDGHIGTDFIVDKGTEVLAALPGTVFAAWNGWPKEPDWRSKYPYYWDYWVNGNFVILDCGNGLYNAYHHLDSINVRETLFTGSNKPKVRRGEVIGHVGNTGLGVGLVRTYFPPHLHFQIWQPSKDQRSAWIPLDPFRDLCYGRHGVSPWSDPNSLWSKDNDPQYAPM